MTSPESESRPRSGGSSGGAPPGTAACPERRQGLVVRETHRRISASARRSGTARRGATQHGGPPLRLSRSSAAAAQSRRHPARPAQADAAPALPAAMVGRGAPVRPRAAGVRRRMCHCTRQAVLLRFAAPPSPAGGPTGTGIQVRLRPSQSAAPPPRDSRAPLGGGLGLRAGATNLSSRGAGATTLWPLQVTSGLGTPPAPPQAAPLAPVPSPAPRLRRSSGLPAAGHRGKSRPVERAARPRPDSESESV
jgi:hypothetical protein